MGVLIAVSSEDGGVGKVMVERVGKEVPQDIMFKPFVFCLSPIRC
jgi:hypothetical protein